MKRMHHKYGVLAIVALALLLGLLLAAGLAAAATTVDTTQGAVMGELDQGTVSVDPVTGTVYTDDYMIYAVTYRATGPDGWRLLGYLVVRIDVVEPLKGDNSHVGVVAVLPFIDENGGDNDPGAWWDDSLTFEQNLVGHDLLWTGTWDGYTLNARNHKADLVLEGVDGSVNEDCSAVGEITSGVYDVANFHAGRYVATPFSALWRVTTP